MPELPVFPAMKSWYIVFYIAKKHYPFRSSFLDILLDARCALLNLARDTYAAMVKFPFDAQMNICITRVLISFSTNSAGSFNKGLIISDFPKYPYLWLIAPPFIHKLFDA